jgi:hypothetical protein
MIPGANGLSSKETWFPTTNGPKFPSKHASLGNGPKVMGKPWFCGEMGSSFEKTTWGKWIAFIHRMQFFSSFHSICNLSFIQCKRFYINFSSIFCNIFFNFSLSNVAYCRQKITKWMNYCALFTQFSLNNLVKGNTSPPSSEKL